MISYYEVRGNIYHPSCFSILCNMSIFREHTNHMRDRCNGITQSNPLTSHNQTSSNSETTLWLNQIHRPRAPLTHQDEQYFWLWQPNEEALHWIQRQHPPAACKSFRNCDELLLGRIAWIRAWLLPVCSHDASIFVQILISKPLRHRTTNGQSGMGIWRTLEEPMRQQFIVARRLLLLRVRQQRRLVAADSIVWSRSQRRLGLLCRYSLEIGGIILDMPQKKYRGFVWVDHLKRASIDRRMLQRKRRATRDIESSASGF